MENEEIPLTPRSLLFDAVANLIVRAIGVIASFALTATLARVLGAKEFGRYSLIIAIVTVLAIPAQAGVPELVLRETAKAHQALNWARMRGLWIWSTRIVATTSLVIAAAAMISLVATELWPEGLSTKTLLLALLFVPLAALGAIRGSILRGLGHIVPGLLPEYLIRPLVAIAAVHVYFIFEGEFNAEIAIQLYVLASAFAFAGGVILLRRLRPRNVVDELREEIDGSGWRASAIVLALMAGMTVLLQQVDILMLGAFATAEQIGFYRVAAQCSLVVSFGLTATLSAVAPHIIRCHSTGDHEAVRKLVVYSARFTAVLSAVPLLVFLFSGEQLLKFMFGDSFSSSMPSLMVLALSQTAIALAGPVSVLLVMTGHERIAARIMSLTILVNALGNLCALIPKYGALGAALGTGAALVLQHVLLSLAVKAKLGFIAAAFGTARAKIK